MSQQIGIPRSPSALLALGSLHPFYVSLRESQTYSLDLVEPPRNPGHRDATDSEESKEDEENANGLPDLVLDNIQVTSSVVTMKKVPSSEALQTRKVTSLSAITTQVGELAEDFTRVIIMEDHQVPQGGAAEVHVGMLIRAFRSMETKMRNAGLSVSAKDVAGNITKVQDMYHRAPVDQRDSMTALLAHEIESGVHSRDRNGNLRLHNNSAAMGLLWLGRNLNYQYDMYKLMLEDNKDPAQASQIAFQQVLEPHLNWAVSKVVQAAISSLTPRKQCTFFSNVGGFDSENASEQQCSASKRDVKQMMEQWQPLLVIWKRAFAQLGLEAI